MLLATFEYLSRNEKPKKNNNKTQNILHERSFFLVRCLSALFSLAYIK